MVDLIRKIQDGGAERLPLPPTGDAAGQLARYKAFLKVETHRIKIEHRGGAGGQEICAARAAMLDALLRHLWEVAKTSLSPQAQKEFPPLALVAIGGFWGPALYPVCGTFFFFFLLRA